MNDESETPADQFDISRYIDAIETQNLGEEYKYSIYSGLGDTWNKVDDSAEIFKRYFTDEAQMVATSHLQNIQLATTLSAIKGLDLQYTYDNLQSILKNMFSGEMVSESTALGRLRETYIQKDLQNKIYELRFAQLNGDTSEQTERRIEDLRVQMPIDSRIDEISAKLQEKGETGKFFAAMGGIPQMFASQLPLWIDNLKYGAAGAALFAGSSAFTGAGALASAFVGGLFGAGVHETAIEAGGMYDQVVQAARENGYKLDPQSMRAGIVVTAALISAIDMGTFGNIATSAVSQSVKKVGLAMVKKIIEESALGRMAFSATEGFIKEGVTEGLQEVMSDMQLELIRNRNEGLAIPEQKFDKMARDFYTAGMMAGPVGMISAGALSGLSSAYTARRSSRQMVLQEAITNAKKIKSDEIRDIIDEQDNVEIADWELVKDKVAEVSPVNRESTEPGEIAKPDVIVPEEAVETGGIDLTERAAKIKELENELGEAEARLKQATVELQGNTATAETVTKIETAQQKAKDLNKQLPLKRVDLEMGAVIPTPEEAPAYVRPGIRVKKNMFIKGVVGDYVYYSDSPDGLVSRASINTFTALSDLSEKQISNRAVKLAEQEIELSPDATVEAGNSNLAIVSLTKQSLEEGLSNGIIFERRGADGNQYSLVSKVNEILYRGGTEKVVGYVSEGRVKRSTNLMEAAQRADLTFEGALPGQQQGFINPPPAGVKIHKEIGDTGQIEYYYFQGEANDIRETQREVREKKEQEANLEEEEAMGPADSQESAIAGGQVGVGEVQTEMDLIEMVDERYIPTDEKGIRYLWRKLGRISYANKFVRTRKELAQLFSAFRHPNIEHVHVAYLDSRDRIILNTCQSSGLAASTSLDMEEIAQKVEDIGASKFYVIHNHPSGDITRSDADIATFNLLNEQFPGKYAGAIILDHDHYSWTGPGEEFATEEKYNPTRRYQKPPTEEYTSQDVAEEIAKRDTAVFVLSGKRKIRAIFTPTRNMTGEELYSTCKSLGGSFYNIASNSPEVRAYYKQEGQRIQGTQQAQMGLVMGIDKNGFIIEDFRGELAGDKLRLKEEQCSQLWEEEDPTFKVKPKTIKAWHSFWDDVVERFNIKRPLGLYSYMNRISDIVNKNGDDYNMDAHVINEGKDFRVRLTDPDNVTIEQDFKIVQGDEGYEIGMIDEQPMTKEQFSLIKNYAMDAAERLFRDGEQIDVNQLSLSEEIKEQIDEYEANYINYYMSSILEVQKNHGLKDKIMLLTEEMASLEENGQVESAEFKYLRQYVWRMAQHYTELEGMASKGINNIKRAVMALAKGKFSPKKFKESVELKIKEFDVRLPMTPKQAKQLEQLKNVPFTKMTKAERALVKWAELPGIETLGYSDLMVLRGALDNFWRKRYALTKFFHGGEVVSLQKGVKEATGEIEKYHKGKIEEVDPADMGKKNALRQSYEFLRSFIVRRQMQMFFTFEHLAGPMSISYQLLYRQLNDADTRWRRYKQKMEDVYHKSLREAGNEELRAKWADEIFEVDGVRLTNAQALAIYMHYENVQNRGSLENSGMYYSDASGGRHFLDPEVFDFKKVHDEMAEDKAAMAYRDAMRKVYDIMGAQTKQTYETMYGRKFGSIENYFPRNVAREFYSQGQEEISPTVGEGTDNRISIVKNFTVERTAENPPIELLKDGAFGVIAQSIEQETKFIHMEMAFFKASKLLYDPKFRETIYNTKGLGEEYWKLMESQLQKWAGEKQDITRTWDRLLLNVRKKATLAGLGMNPITAAKAGISWAYALRFLDPRSAAEGLRRAALPGSKQELMAKSAVFRDRVIGGSLPEVNDIMAERTRGADSYRLPKKGEYNHDKVMFWLLTAVDAKTVTAVMEGAIYQAELAFAQNRMTINMQRALGFTEETLAHMSQEEKLNASISYAEWVLQRTQPDFRPQSRNAFQNGTPIERLASVFGSFVTITHGMAWDLLFRLSKDGLDGVGVKEMIMSFALMVAVAGGNDGIDRLKNALTGKDQATLGEFIAKALFNNTFIVRDISDSFMSKMKYGAFAGKGGNDSFVRGMDTGITGAILTINGLLNGNDHDLYLGLNDMFECVSGFAGAPVATTELVVDTLKNVQEK